VLTRIPGVHRALGYAVGMGARPEHVRTKSEQLLRPSRVPRAAFAAAGIAAAGLALAWLTRRSSCRS
jgi:hypothetical protein